MAPSSKARRSCRRVTVARLMSASSATADVPAGLELAAEVARDRDYYRSELAKSAKRLVDSQAQAEKARQELLSLNEQAKQELMDSNERAKQELMKSNERGRQELLKQIAEAEQELLSGTPSTLNCLTLCFHPHSVVHFRLKMDCVY